MFQMREQNQIIINLVIVREIHVSVTFCSFKKKSNNKEGKTGTNRNVS